MAGLTSRSTSTCLLEYQLWSILGLESSYFLMTAQDQ